MAFTHGLTHETHLATLLPARRHHRGGALDDDMGRSVKDLPTQAIRSSVAAAMCKRQNHRLIETTIDHFISKLNGSRKGLPKQGLTKRKV